MPMTQEHRKLLERFLRGEFLCSLEVEEAIRAAMDDSAKLSSIRVNSKPTPEKIEELRTLVAAADQDCDCTGPECDHAVLRERAAFALLGVATELLDAADDRAWIYNVTLAENVPGDMADEVNNILRLERERLEHYRNRTRELQAEVDAVEFAFIGHQDEDMKLPKFNLGEAVKHVLAERDAFRAEVDRIKTHAYVESLRKRAEHADQSADHRALVIGDFQRKLEAAEKEIKRLKAVLAEVRAAHLGHQCHECGQMTDDAVALYRHHDHPGGKCTETFHGPSVVEMIDNVMSRGEHLKGGE